MQGGCNCRCLQGMMSTSLTCCEIARLLKYHVLEALISAAA